MTPCSLLLLLLLLLLPLLLQLLLLQLLLFEFVKNKLKTNEISFIYSTRSCVKARAQLIVKVGLSVLCNSD